MFILGTYCEAVGLLPEEQWRFHPCRSIVEGMIPTVRKLQELERTARVPVFSCVSSACRKHTIPSTPLSCGGYYIACLGMSLGK